jgi:HSP20 family protein
MIDRNAAFGPSTSLRHVMDRLLEEAVVAPRQSGSTSWGGPALDIYEEGDTLVVEAQLPGLKADDIDVNVERGVLTISGKTTAESESKGRNYLVREQRVGQFSRSFQLPAVYNADPGVATYEHGVLRLVFSKSEQAKPRRIQLNTDTHQQAVINGPSNGQPTEAGTSGRQRS